MTPQPRIGRYELKARLGDGANGEVFRVTGEDGAPLALKRLRADHPRVTDIKREFRIVADLYQRNLVLPHSLELDEHGPFFTMELVEGQPWTTWVREVEPPERYDRLRQSLVQLCTGLAALHARGLVHRDVKPSNVLVEPSGRVAILDFGLTQPATSEDPGGFSGTPAYCAPEILWGGAATAASDAYAVGVLTHEALTGALPYDADVQRSVARRLDTDLPPLVGVPPDLAQICERLLAREATERWGTSEVLERLDPSGSLLGGLDSTRALVGRERELEVLRATWRRAEASRASAVVALAGHSGMGKSALLRAFAVEQRPRAWVLEGRCYERDATPYRALDTALDELERRLRLLGPQERGALVPDDLEALAASFPALASAFEHEKATPSSTSAAEPTELRRRASAALAQLFARVGEQHGVVLLLDDLQWGDEDSARLLTDIVVGDPPRLLIVAAHRAEATEGPFLTELRRLRGQAAFVELDIGPLDLDASTSLASSICNGGSELVASAVAQAEGCPFMIELLLSLGQSDPAEIDRSLRARIDELSPAARQVLEVVCHASRPLEQSRVQRAVSGEAPTWLDWASLSGARLVRSTHVGQSNAVEPYHDRIREAVAATLEPDARTEVHRRLGVAFASEPLDAEGAATHFALAGDAATAFPYARSAAEWAQRTLAFDRAVQMLELSIACAPKGDLALREQLELRLATCLADAGYGARAGAMFTALADRKSGPEPLDLRREAMEHLLVAGRIDEGAAAMTKLLDALGLRTPHRPEWIEARMLVELGALLLRGPKLARSRPLSAREQLEVETFASIGKGFSSFDANLGSWFFLRAARRALRWGAYEPALHGLAYSASLLGFIASDFSVRRAHRWLDTGEEWARSAGDDHGLAVCQVARGMVACCIGSWATALTHFDEGAAKLAGHPASRWESNTARTTSLVALLQLGRVDELRRRATALSTEGRARGDLALEVEAAMYLSYGCLADDEVRAALGTIERALTPWRIDRYLFQSWIATRLRTLARLYAGDGEGALQGMEADLPRLKKAKLDSLQIVRIESLDLLGRCCIATVSQSADGTLKRRLERLRGVIDDLEKIPRPHALGPAASFRAALASIEGRSEEASSRLQAAEAHYERADMVMHRLSVAWHRARLLRDIAERGRIEAKLREQGVRNPASWVRMYLPLGASC